VHALSLCIVHYTVREVLMKNRTCVCQKITPIRDD
jgi:hypothetical protein